MLEWLTPAVGTVIGSGLTALGLHKSNKQAKSSAREQMEFQREMSNTAHQRQVADLRSAGLNPILSSHKSGASTPQGAKYEPKNAFEKAVQTALMGSQAETALANASSAKEQARLNKYNADIKKLDLKHFISTDSSEAELKNPFNTYINKIMKGGHDIVTELQDLIPNYYRTRKQATALEGMHHRSFMEATRSNPKMNPFSRKTWNRKGRSSGGDHNKVPHFGTIYRRYKK